MYLHVYIYVGGALTLIVAVYHSQLYKKLNWSEEFKKIDMNNARVIYTINLALTLLFVLIGIISLLFAQELSKSKGLALGFNLAISGFWIWRFMWQMTYQKPKRDQKLSRVGIEKLMVPIILAACYLIPVAFNFILA